MDREDRRDPTYVIGRSENGARCLEGRAEFFDRPTRVLFEDAGITTGDIWEVGVGHDFDAVVGRLVLMYSANPVATLRATTSRL